ncbi:Nitroreductase [Massilia sp. PDC64]|nr:nitroreductase [Massilia sp. PDC64]SDE75525.1 Nitroreductase [Massilia sp. PDC64]
MNSVHYQQQDDADLRESAADNVSEVVDRVMRGRAAVRRFLDRPVDRGIVADILDVARSAPSNSNTQPWRVHALAGEAKDALCAALGDAHANRPEAYTPCYKHFPDVLGARYAARQAEFGAIYYGCLGIDFADTVRRNMQTAQNFRFFGAPVGLIFTIDSSLERGSWIDYGMFLQNIMLAAKARGLDTCPQISFVKYHEIIRQHLSISPDETIVCGMSMGYADTSARVNALGLSREPVTAFTSFLGFDN